MSLSPKDMNFIAARNGAAREIALAFGVPPTATETEPSLVVRKYKKEGVRGIRSPGRGAGREPRSRSDRLGSMSEGAMADTGGKATAWIGRDTTTVNRKEFDRILRELTTGATETETPGAYRGLWYLRSDNTVVGVRISEFYGYTIDIVDSGGNALLRTGARIHCLD
nr:hypothetical protein [Hyphomicrobium sp.]